MVIRNEIALTWSTDSWDCELCGMIYDEKLSVEFNGVEVLELESDGHFGNGDELDDPSAVVNAILKAIDSPFIHVDVEESDDHRNETIEKALKGLGYSVITNTGDEYA